MACITVTLVHNTKQAYQIELQILLKNHGCQISNPASYNLLRRFLFISNLQFGSKTSNINICDNQIRKFDVITCYKVTQYMTKKVNGIFFRITSAKKMVLMCK